MVQNLVQEWNLVLVSHKRGNILLPYSSCTSINFSPYLHHFVPILPSYCPILHQSASFLPHSALIAPQLGPILAQSATVLTPTSPILLLFRSMWPSLYPTPPLFCPVLRWRVPVQMFCSNLLHFLHCFRTRCTSPGLFICLWSSTLAAKLKRAVMSCSWPAAPTSSRTCTPLAAPTTNGLMWRYQVMSLHAYKVPFQPQCNFGSMLRDNHLKCLADWNRFSSRIVIWFHPHFYQVWPISQILLLKTIYISWCYHHCASV